MTPEAVDLLKWTLGGVVTALGGSSAVIGGIRRGALWLKTRGETKKRIAVIRADNEEFKSEVRRGLKDLEVVKTGIQRLDANIRAQAHLDPRPMFFACDAGKVTFVNRQFTKLLGWTIDDMRDLGIINAFHVDDQRRVATEWAHAIRDHRTLVTRARLQHATGLAQPEARIEALVMRCADDTVYGWQGILQVDGARP